MNEKFNGRSLLTIKEVVPLLNVKESTLRSWVRQKKVPVIRLGRCVRIKYEVIQNIQERGL